MILQNVGDSALHLLRHGIRVGISGWRYKGWHDRFYPGFVRMDEQLRYAGRVFNSIEINGSFYSLGRPEWYGRWFEDVPDDFVFAVKGGRYITHIRRLVDVRPAVANFMASGILRLGHKLGPILWQFPPTMKFSDAARFEQFMQLLPRSTAAAAALARDHEPRLSGRAWVDVHEDRPLRHAFEMRHPSFVTDAFFDLLAQHGMGWVIADAAGRYPLCEEVTSDFVYIRLHGASELYVSGYDEAALGNWADHVRRLASGMNVPGASRCRGASLEGHGPRDVYVYFDNDAKVFAPYNALRLAALVGASPIVPVHSPSP
jgi:uncharacterized protein YecE (DUF72 family)